MKGKIIFPQTKCKSIVPDSIITQMKNALKVIEYPDAIIGPKTVKEVLELNADKTGYSHCIFNELISEKIISDYNTITDGLELLKFYKERNKYFTAFDSDIEALDKMRLDQNKTKFVTTDIVINIENITMDDIGNDKNKNKKIWLAYFNGELKTDVPDTLSKTILFAKNCMFYRGYTSVVIKPKTVDKNIIDNTVSEKTKIYIENNYKLTEVSKEACCDNYTYLMGTIENEMRYFLLSKKLGANKNEIIFQPVHYKDLNDIDSVDVLLYYSDLHQTNFLYRLTI